MYNEITASNLGMFVSISDADFSMTIASDHRVNQTVQFSPNWDIAYQSGIRCNPTGRWNQWDFYHFWKYIGHIFYFISDIKSICSKLIFFHAELKLLFWFQFTCLYILMFKLTKNQWKLVKLSRTISYRLRWSLSHVSQPFHVRPQGGSGSDRNQKEKLLKLLINFHSNWMERIQACRGQHFGNIPSYRRTLPSYGEENHRWQIPLRHHRDWKSRTCKKLMKNYGKLWGAFAICWFLRLVQLTTLAAYIGNHTEVKYVLHLRCRSPIRTDFFYR